MSLEPRITHIEAKTLVGQKVKMSFVANKTRELWKGFMPRLSEIQNRTSTDYFSLQVYPESFFKGGFSPFANFIKHALVEVSSTETIPDGMEVFELPAGRYAVFTYTGTSKDSVSFFMSIFNKWLPKSGYELEHRPQFEILPKDYKKDDPNATEEIWIPIKD